MEKTSETLVYWNDFDNETGEKTFKQSCLKPRDVFIETEVWLFIQKCSSGFIVVKSTASLG
jgi:hypothetical protein